MTGTTGRRRGAGRRDRIEVRGLRLDGIHGVLAEEQVAPQPFEVDLDLYLDLVAAASSDDLADSADYGAAVQAAAEVVAGAPHRLLESLAASIAAAVLDQGRIDAVTVVVRKLRPPLPFTVLSTGVRLHRHRGEPAADEVGGDPTGGEGAGR